MVGRFAELGRRGLRVIVKVLGGEEGLECEVCVDGILGMCFGRIRY